MRLGWSKSKYSVSYYAQKTTYVDGKDKSVIVKRFGTDKQICEKYGVTDAKAWAKEQVEMMNREEEEKNGKYLIPFTAGKPIDDNQQRRFNGGYLFLQDIYHELGLDRISKAIAKKHSFEYNLNSILSRLIYTRILYPSSKLGTFEESQRFIEKPDFELQQIYRALSVIAEESDYIQSTIFKNSSKIEKRNTSVIYYDCTNFYFEIDHTEGDKQYGVSKENRPLPIVQMGLFMDREGIPLAFSINPGNTNEQTTLVPLEEKLSENFDMSKFVVCTDAGLSSTSNRKYNDYSDEDGNLRRFITVQSLKTLKGFLKEWGLSDDEWILEGVPRKKFKISKLDEKKYHDCIFYKSRWIKENGLEQQLIVTFSLKYRDYQRDIRNRQIERAIKAAKKGRSATEHTRRTDPLRFVKVDHATDDGEAADKSIYSIDEELIREEEKYDGFYAACSNLEDDPVEIIEVNKHRWEIEECFRIMKSDFEARPVYLQRRERILAHFITCFIALIVYRYLEKKLNGKYTCREIIRCLQGMDFLKFEGFGYVPTYEKNKLTDDLHNAFGFTTSDEIIPASVMRNICAKTKGK